MTYGDSILFEWENDVCVFFDWLHEICGLDTDTIQTIRERIKNEYDLKRFVHHFDGDICNVEMTINKYLRA